MVPLQTGKASSTGRREEEGHREEHPGEGGEEVQGLFHPVVLEPIYSVVVWFLSRR
jgi:hypothetical protein